MRALSIISLLAIPWQVTCLVNPIRNLFGASRSTSTSSNIKTEEDGDQLLRDLGVESPTKPRPAAARLEKVPALLAASAPLVLRGLSGFWALDYGLSVTEANLKQYSYVTLPFDKQTLETGRDSVPDLPLVLYEDENSAKCRAVREACSMLSLPVTFRPVPGNKATLFKSDLEKNGGRSVPFLMDVNTGREVEGFTDIIDYLFLKYGDGKVPPTLESENTVLLVNLIGLTVAKLAGWTPSASSVAKAIEKPLVLWMYEGSPFCKQVRDLLNALELEHTVIFVPRGSPNRQKLYEKKRRFQVPYFEDPNTGVAIFESDAICEYIEKMYAVDVRVKYM